MVCSIESCDMVIELRLSNNGEVKREDQGNEGLVFFVFLKNEILG